MSAQLTFDYAALDRDTRRFVQERAERIHNLARMTAASIVQIGQYLSECKERLGHGKFLEWIEREFAWTYKSAERFMHVHEHLKLDKLSNLQIDVSALYLIAAPSTPDPVRVQAVIRAQDGEHVTHMGARELVRRFQETGELPEVKTSLAEILEQRRSRMEPEQTPPARDRERDQHLREEVKANTAQASLVMDVIRSIETLNRTPLTVNKIISEIRRLDTPDKNWRGKTIIASQMLAAVARGI